MRGIVVCAAVTILLAIALGVRSAARELMAPIDGIDRIVRSKSTINVETELAATAESSIEIPVDPIQELDESTSISFASLQAIQRELEKLWGSQGPRLFVQQEISRPPTLSESQRAMLAEWDQWKSQTIAALPESIREDSDYRKAIEEVYARACGPILDSAQIRDVVAEVEVSLQMVGFTDIDEQTEAEFVTPESARLEIYDLRAPSAHPTLMRLSWGSFPIGEPGVEVTRE